MSRVLVAATGNRGKLAELERLLDGLGWEVVAQSVFGIEPPPEDGLTFVENAIVKARHATQRTGRPALADDSGLVVDALGGAPGVRSARYAGEGGDDAANNAKLVRALAGVPAEARTAPLRVRCRLDARPRGSGAPHRPGDVGGPGARGAAGRANGFGYDPLFLDLATQRTAAELEPERKTRPAIRGKALRALRSMLAGLAD